MGALLLRGLLPETLPQAAAGNQPSSLWRRIVWADLASIPVWTFGCDSVAEGGTQSGLGEKGCLYCSPAGMATLAPHWTCFPSVKWDDDAYLGGRPEMQCMRAGLGNRGQKVWWAQKALLLSLPDFCPSSAAPPCTLLSRILFRSCCCSASNTHTTQPWFSVSFRGWQVVLTAQGLPCERLWYFYSFIKWKLQCTHRDDGFL